MNDKLRPETLIASASVGAENPFGAVAPPLILSSTYAWPDPTQKPAFDYSRTVNPTRAGLERVLADLEGAAGGIVTASGMTALDLLLNLLTPDDLLVAPHDCYGGTYRLYAALEKKGRFKVAFVDQTDEAAYATAIARKPKMVLIETPSNPLMRITDVATCAKLAKDSGAIVVADNTFLTPLRQRPLDLGCDIVVHSTTKFLNGHSDVVGGCVLTKDPELHKELAWWANAVGATGAPFDAYQTLRGLRTLSVRLNAQEAAAIQVADALGKSDLIEKTYYPGLASHPGHDVAKRQQSGPGAVLAFDLKGGVPAAVAFLRALRVFNVGASLGGFESLATNPAVMTHAGMAREARLAAGLGDGLIRLSIGLEAIEDLIADLNAGLAAARGAEAA
jgi:cystathionine gamma-synthase